MTDNFVEKTNFNVYGVDVEDLRGKQVSFQLYTQDSIINGFTILKSDGSVTDYKDSKIPNSLYPCTIENYICTLEIPQDAKMLWFFPKLADPQTYITYESGNIDSSFFVDELALQINQLPSVDDVENIKNVSIANVNCILKPIEFNNKNLRHSVIALLTELVPLISDTLVIINTYRNFVLMLKLLFLTLLSVVRN